MGAKRGLTDRVLETLGCEPRHNVSLEASPGEDDVCVAVDLDGETLGVWRAGGEEGLPEVLGKGLGGVRTSGRRRRGSRLRDRLRFLSGPGSVCPRCECRNRRGGRHVHCGGRSRDSGQDGAGRARAW